MASQTSNNALLNEQNSGPTNLNIVQDGELPTRKIKKVSIKKHDSSRKKNNAL